MSEINNLGWADTVGRGYHAVQEIETDVPRATLESLLDRTAKQWMRLGDSDPYWSVLTDESNRGQRLSAERERAFYSSGVFAGSVIDLFERRNRRRLARGSCLELGCGVGRLTLDLSKNFDHVIAVDVSRANIEICRSKLDAEGIRNVDLRHVGSLKDFSLLPQHDVFFSFIVLQHNSPPVQKAILDECLSKTGDGCLFQTASNLIGYQFSSAEYLKSGDSGMEVHALPQVEVLSLLRKHALEIHEVLPDNCLGAFGSFTFFASRSLGSKGVLETIPIGADGR